MGSVVIPSPLIRYTCVMDHRFVVVAVFLFLVLFLFVNSVNFVNSAKRFADKKCLSKGKVSLFDIFGFHICVLLDSKSCGHGWTPSNFKFRT